MLWGALLLALSLSIIHYFSDIFSKLFERFHVPILSFSAGMFLSLVFIELMPEAMAGQQYLNIFLAVFLGFVAFHLTEKYVYQHIRNKHEMLKDLKLLHEAGFFIEHSLIGFFLVLVFRMEGLYSMLVFVPLALHTVSSSLSMEAIHLQSKSSLHKIVLSLSTLIGALAAIAMAPSGFLYYGFFSLALGALFYIGVRDMMPLNRESPWYFVLGVMLNFALFALARIMWRMY